MTSYKLILGDSIDVMSKAKPESVDSLVADAPYALNFMGLDFDKPAEMLGTALGISGGFNRYPPGVKRPEIKKNDPHMFEEWCRLWGEQALRVMKPGAYGVCFGSTRTFHRLVSGLEDAGFEIRDTLMYLHGQGMPKGRNVSKEIDKRLGAERKVIGEVDDAGMSRWNGYRHGDYENYAGGKIPLTEHSTEEAKQWDGWNTQLTPAVEPIILFQKKFKGSIAANVLEHGVGALNVGACRIPMSEQDEATRAKGREAWSKSMQDGSVGNAGQGVALASALSGDSRLGKALPPLPPGRHPKNVIIDDCAASMIDASTKNASRLFYHAKPSKSEKLAGVPEDLPKRLHETTKGLDLMRYLVRLITPPGGVVLDPFLGSGTTLCAAMLEGMRGVGIERDEAYMEIARHRIAHWARIADEEAQERDLRDIELVEAEHAR